MSETEEKKEIGKEEIEKRKRWREEINDLIDWERHISKGCDPFPSEERRELLLFNINNNLKRIADSLDAIFLKM